MTYSKDHFKPPMHIMPMPTAADIILFTKLYINAFVLLFVVQCTWETAFLSHIEMKTFCYENGRVSSNAPYTQHFYNYVTMMTNIFVDICNASRRDEERKKGR